MTAGYPWPVVTLGAHATFLRTASNPRSDLGNHEDIRYLHYGDIHGHGGVRLDTPSALPGIAEEKVRGLPRLEDGDLVIVDASEDLEGTGKSVEIANLGEHQLVAGLHTIALRLDKHMFVDGFKGYLQHHPDVRSTLRRLAAGTSVYAISANHVASIELAIPPTNEQKAIATALRDVDSLIDSLDELIAKKRDLQVAVSRALLSGVTRLPGFGDEWEVAKVGDLGSFLKGGGISKSDLTPSGVPCVLYGEIYTRHHDWIRRFHSYIPPRLASKATELKEGDILFTGSGETAEDIGKSVAFLGGERAYAGGDIVILRGSRQNPLFLGYALNSHTVNAQKARLGQGATVIHVNASHLAELTLPLPPIDEQKAIGGALSDMDAEIDTLVAQREKTALLMQGAMHELITGRTRLVA